MPFTPFHMGPGIALKALLHGSFSLMIFGWAQIVMDIQPLVVLITGVGHLHGFSHTYIGAILLAIFAALSGKYLALLGLFLLGLNACWQVKIAWGVAFLSAFIGTCSHVLLDSIMHADIQPWWPLTTVNNMLGLVSIDTLHRICLYSGMIGGVVYFAVCRLVKFNKRTHPAR